MPKHGMIRYKCRHCHEEYDGVFVHGLADSLRRICNGGAVSCHFGAELGLYDVHECGDGWIGISDLVGGVTNEAWNKETTNA